MELGSKTSLVSSANRSPANLRQGPLVGRASAWGRRLAFPAIALIFALGAGPALAMPILDYDLSDPNVIALESSQGEYAATLNQPSADPTFTFSAGDVMHMSGSVTFNELHGGTTALLVFTSFREAPTVTCGTPPPPRLDASPGADVNTDLNVFQGSAIQSSPVGGVCSVELDGQPFLAMVVDQVIPGQARNFQFDLVLDGPMDGAAGLRAYYQGYSVVPEPSTALLLGLGLLGVAAGRRRR